MTAPRNGRAEDTKSIAIVGAGPGGLAAAVLLAASGWRVRVYEAQPEIGGRTARLALGEYAFDRGPTFFLMPYVLDEIFSAAGRRLADYADLTPLDPMYRILVGDPEGGDSDVIDATRDIEEMSRRLSTLDARDGAAFPRFITDNRAKLNAAEPILRRSIRSPMDLVRLDAIKALPHIRPHLSVHQLLRRYFRHPSVQMAVSFQSKYLGMSPFECPSLFTILPFIEYEWGIWHPRGGCNALMKALADVLIELGGEIVTESPIETIEFQGRRAVGVRTGGRTHHHEHVVVNADAAWAIKNLIPEPLRPRRYRDSAVDRRRYSCSTFMMYLGVDGEVDLPHHTIYISSQYEKNLRDIGAGRLSGDPSIYLCNASVTDPTLAPPGKSSLYVLMPTPNCRSDIDWSAERDRLAQTCFEQLEHRLGTGDLRGRIEQQLVYTPADWETSNINFGATFNLAHNIGQMLHKRPQHKLEGFERLWLVGGGTHPGSGLPVIFLSSQITSQLICNEGGFAYAGASVADGHASGSGGTDEPYDSHAPQAIPA